MKVERLTAKTEEGYAAADMEAALRRLGRLEDLYEALCAEQEKIAADMERLSEAGRTKSATYRQLFAGKLNVTNLISRMEARVNAPLIDAAIRL